MRAALKELFLGDVARKGCGERAREDKGRRAIPLPPKDQLTTTSSEEEGVNRPKASIILGNMLEHPSTTQVIKILQAPNM
jgi:hypothetical protein